MILKREGGGRGVDTHVFYTELFFFLLVCFIFYLFEVGGGDLMKGYFCYADAY